MATISDVAIAVAGGQTSETSDVTVSGAMTFVSSDVGKKYRLEIKLHGDDSPTDNRPLDDGVSDDDLYTYRFGPRGAEYMLVSVTAAGSQTFSETRTLQNAILNEDSGKGPGPEPGKNNPNPQARADEVYARATLFGAGMTARSANWETPGV
jgi:hypothetical protein